MNNPAVILIAPIYLYVYKIIVVLSQDDILDILFTNERLQH